MKLEPQHEPPRLVVGPSFDRLPDAKKAEVVAAAFAKISADNARLNTIVVSVAGVDIGTYSEEGLRLVER